MPERIQRKRTRGWRMPEGAVYVGRPGVFGNPFGGSHYVDSRSGEEVEAGAQRAVQESVRAYREFLLSGIENRPAHTGHLWGAVDAAAGYRIRYKMLAALPRLRGKDLACWCPVGQPCHADVLLEIANAN